MKISHRVSQSKSGQSLQNLATTQSHPSVPGIFFSVVQRSANLSCKSLDCKYFRPHGLPGLYCNYSALSFYPESSHRQCVNEGVWLHSNKTSQKEQLVRCGLQAVCWPLAEWRETVPVSGHRAGVLSVPQLTHSTSLARSLLWAWLSHQEVRGGVYFERGHCLQILGD